MSGRLRTTRRVAFLAACLALAGACTTRGPAARDAEAAEEPPAAATPEPAEPGEGKAGPGTAPPGSALPPELAEALAREAEPLPRATLRAPDGSFEAEVPARILEPPERLDNRTLVRLDVGSTNPVECSIFEGAAELAAALQEISASLLRSAGVEARQVHRIDAGAVGKTPFLALDWIYRAEVDGRVAVSILKQRMASRDGHTVYCLHDELGYAGTFARLFHSLVETLAVRGFDAPIVYFHEVSVASAGRLTLGVTSLAVGRDGNGAVRAESRLAMLMPLAPDQVLAQDTLEVELASEAGELVRRAVIESRNGAPVTQLSLEREDEGQAARGAWAVRGIHEGEPLEATLGPSETLLAIPGQYRVVREALEAGQDRIAYPAWVPEMDPKGLVDVEIEVTERLGDDRVGAIMRIVPRDGGPEAEELRMHTVIDAASGAPLRSELPLGATTLRLERILVHGQP